MNGGWASGEHRRGIKNSILFAPQTKAVTERVASELPESEVFQGQTSKGVSKVRVAPSVHVSRLALEAYD